MTHPERDTSQPPARRARCHRAARATRLCVDTGRCRRRHPLRSGGEGLVCDQPANLRRPGRSDRGHATHPGRRETLDRSAPVPARPQLLHAAARTRSPTARHLHRLATERPPRRAGRRHLVRAARHARPARPVRDLRRLRRHPAADRTVPRPVRRRDRHRHPGCGPGQPPRPHPPRPHRPRHRCLPRPHVLRRPVPHRDSRCRPNRVGPGPDLAGHHHPTDHEGRR